MSALLNIAVLHAENLERALQRIHDIAKTAKNGSLTKEQTDLIIEISQIALPEHQTLTVQPRRKHRSKPPLIVKQEQKT